MITQALTTRLWEFIKDSYQSRLDDVMCSGNLFDSHYTHTVEEKIKNITNRKHAVFTNSGSSAILIGLIAHKIGPGDEVICPNLSYVASANQIAVTGAKPVFVDVTNTGHIDVNKIENRITTRTRAIMPVGLYGENYDHDAVQEIADRYSIPIIEDSAQSYGTLYKDRPAGSLGHTSILSFSRNKPAMTPFGAGALVTDDDDIAHRARIARTHGKQGRNGTIHCLGLNAQAKEDRAIAVDIALDNFRSWNARRQEIHKLYSDTVANNQCILNKPLQSTSTVNGHKFIFLSRDPEIWMDNFRHNNIEALRYYQDNFEYSMLGSSIHPMPQTEQFINQSVTITTDPFLTASEIESICQVLETVYL